MKSRGEGVSVIMKSRGEGVLMYNTHALSLFEGIDLFYFQALRLLREGSDEDPIEEEVLPGGYNPTLVDRMDEDEEIGDEDSDEDCALTAEDGEFGCNTIFCKV